MQKYVLITGAASGIGHHIAHRYSQLNDYIVFCVDVYPIENLTNCTSFQCDLRDETSVRELFGVIPKLDLAVNCAGVSSLRKPLTDFSQSEIIHAWQDNFIPAFNATKHEVQMMRTQRSGNIVNIASITGHIGMKNFLAYGAAKAAILNMTKVAAIEHASDNIRVNSISPATIDTPMIRKKYGGQLKDYSNVYHTNRCGTVEDVYSVVRMFEENQFMTGYDVKLDGGMTELFQI